MRIRELMTVARTLRRLSKPVKWPARIMPTVPVSTGVAALARVISAGCMDIGPAPGTTVQGLVFTITTSSDAEVNTIVYTR